MVKITYLNNKGDEPKVMALQEAIPVLEKEIDKKNLVINEDERRIVTKATMGQLQEESNIAVYKPTGGG
jgi:hypothetical protein